METSMKKKIESKEA